MSIFTTSPVQHSDEKIIDITRRFLECRPGNGKKLDQAITLLKFLRDFSDYKNPILHGGALRDIYLGLTPRDYDIFVSEPFETAPPAALRVERRVPLVGSLSLVWETQAAKPPCFEDDEIALRAQRIRTERREFDLAGTKVDVNYRSNVQTLNEAASYGDAPINAIAMNESGRIMAHRDFIDHAGQKLYLIGSGLSATQARRTLERAHRIAERLPGLKIVREENQAPQAGVLSI